MRAARLRNAGLLGLVLAVALVAAGCGEKSDSGGGSTGTTAAAPAVDEALAAKVPDAIKSDGKIVVGTDTTYSPNEFLDTDGKTPIGWDIDLFAAVAAKLGLKAEFRSAKFPELITAIQSGKYEIGVS
jgi:polar amino acid transport system substrate-binding protein